jgi:ADP-heptose:LPS heptosyltransferase
MVVNQSKVSFVPRLFSHFAGIFKKEQHFILPGDVIHSAKLLFIDSGDIVDLLFIYSVINYFHRNFPNINNSIVVDRSHEEFAKKVLRVDSVITYEGEKLRFYSRNFFRLVKKLKSISFESVILLNMNASFERFLLAYLSGARVRIGFASQLSFPFINCEIAVPNSTYQGEKIKRIINSIGLKPDTNEKRLRLDEGDINRAKQMIHFRKPEKSILTIGVDPGEGKEKHYVIPEIIAYLANNLAVRIKAKFLVLTEPWDNEGVIQFSRYLKSEVLDIVPACSNETIALLSTCDLFISGNTNLFHFAAALGIPTIGLFTEHEDKKWIPPYNNVRIFRGKKGEKLSLKNFFAIVKEVLPI